MGSSPSRAQAEVPFAPKEVERAAESMVQELYSRGLIEIKWEKMSPATSRSDNAEASAETLTRLLKSISTGKQNSPNKLADGCHATIASPTTISSRGPAGKARGGLEPAPEEPRVCDYIDSQLVYEHSNRIRHGDHPSDHDHDISLAEDDRTGVVDRPDSRQQDNPPLSEHPSGNASHLPRTAPIAHPVATSNEGRGTSIEHVHLHTSDNHSVESADISSTTMCNVPRAVMNSNRAHSAECNNGVLAVSRGISADRDRSGDTGSVHQTSAAKDRLGADESKHSSEQVYDLLIDDINGQSCNRALDSSGGKPDDRVRDPTDDDDRSDAAVYINSDDLAGVVPYANIYDRPGTSVYDRPNADMSEQSRAEGYDRPNAPVSNNPQTVICDYLAANTNDFPTAAANDRLKAHVYDRPGAHIYDRPGAVSCERSGAAANDRLAAYTNDCPSATVNDRPDPSASDRESLDTSICDRLAVHTNDDPTAPSYDRQDANVYDRPDAHIYDRPGTATCDLPTANTNNHPGADQPVPNIPAVYDRPVTTNIDIPGAAVYDHPVTSIHNRAAAPVHNRPETATIDPPGAVVYDPPGPVVHDHSEAAIYDRPGAAAHDRPAAAIKNHSDDLADDRYGTSIGELSEAAIYDRPGGAVYDTVGPEPSLEEYLETGVVEYSTATNRGSDAVVAANHQEITSHVAKTLYDELFPTKPTSRKRQLAGNFPDADDFSEPMTLLGEGNFGRTFKSVLKGVPVVLKVSKIRSERANAADYHEWSVNERLNKHPNVLQIIGLCPSFSHLDFSNMGTTAIISPLQQNGSLASFLKDACDISDERQLANIAFGMIQGVRSLHEQRAIHRDVAVRNYLVDDDGRIVLCDFGLTEFLPAGKDSFDASAKREKLPWRWLAPESLDGVFSRESDIWMYGNALVEVVTNRMPWPKISTCRSLNDTFENKRLPLLDLEGVPAIIKEVIEECLQLNPLDRPSARDIAEKLVRWQFDEGTEQLRVAVENGNVDEVTELLATGRAAVNAPRPNAVTPMLLAQSNDMRVALMRHQPVPEGNSEASDCEDFAHNANITALLFQIADCTDTRCSADSIRLMATLQWPKTLIDVNKRVEDNQSPLHLAAKAVLPEGIEYLDTLLCLDIYDINERDRLGQTPLHLAVKHMHLGSVEVLLSKQSVYTTFKNGNTYVERNSADPCGEEIVRLNSSVNIKDNVGKTPLHYAASKGHFKILSTLLAVDEIDVNAKDEKGYSPLHEAVSAESTLQDEERVGVIKALLAHASINVNARTILEAPPKTGGVRNFVAATPLHIAAAKGFFAAAKLLTSVHNMDANVRDYFGRTALSNAVSADALEIVTMLLGNDAGNVHETDENGRTLLQFAIMDGALRTGEFLINHSDVDVNAVDESGDTALHLVSRTNSFFIFQDSERKTKQELEKNKCRVRLGEILLSHKSIDVNKKNGFGDTPLHILVAMDDIYFANALLSHADLDVNVQDNSGDTALHLACSDLEDDAEMASLLLKHRNINTSTSILNDEMQTPLEMARFSEFKVLSKLMEDFTPKSGTFS